MRYIHTSKHANIFINVFNSCIHRNMHTCMYIWITHTFTHNKTYTYNHAYIKHTCKQTFVFLIVIVIVNFRFLQRPKSEVAGTSLFTGARIYTCVHTHTKTHFRLHGRPNQGKWRTRRSIERGDYIGMEVHAWGRGSLWRPASHVRDNWVTRLQFKAG